jgi:hypothetical protein
MRRKSAACAMSTRTCSEHWVLWARRRWVDAELVWMGSEERILCRVNQAMQRALGVCL